VPARNEAHNIRRRAESLLGQRCPSSEVMVVDDLSTDATPYISLAEMARDRVKMYQSLGEM
jgi:glycosyltransferase involved in cell wall biosynthesis